MTILCTYNYFLLVEKMQCGYKELLLLRTFPCELIFGFVISRVDCTYVLCIQYRRTYTHMYMQDNVQTEHSVSHAVTMVSSMEWNV